MEIRPPPLKDKMGKHDPSIAMKELNESLMTITQTLDEIVTELKTLNKEIKNYRESQT